MGTVAGSLVNCSHVSDLVPAMTALNAQLSIARLAVDGSVQVRRVLMDEFIVGDGEVALENNEGMRLVTGGAPSKRVCFYVTACQYMTPFQCL